MPTTIRQAVKEIQKKFPNEIVSVQIKYYPDGRQKWELAIWDRRVAEEHDSLDSALADLLTPKLQRDRNRDWIGS